MACDGGEIFLRKSRSEGAILLEVGALDRLHVNATCKGEGKGGAEAFMIEAEPDDRLFLLNATSVRTCTVQPFKPFLDHRGE